MMSSRGFTLRIKNASRHGPRAGRHLSSYFRVHYRRVERKVAGVGLLKRPTFRARGRMKTHGEGDFFRGHLQAFLLDNFSDNLSAPYNGCQE